jgi:Tol biopolymer transport system component
MKESHRLFLLLVSVAVLNFPGCGGGSESASPAPTFRVSLESGGAQSDSWSDEPSISADGRYVAFASPADHLVPGDTNGVVDVFVRDLVGRTTVLVSVGSSGAAGDDFSFDPSISPDGRFVAFASRATTLCAGDGNDQIDVFVRDLVAGTTARASVDSQGREGDGYSQNPSISADGRFVAFESRASNLVPGDTNGVEDVFVHDLLEGDTIRVSVDSLGAQGDYASSAPAISADGRYVAFESASETFVADDANLSVDVFRHDMLTRRTEWVSVGANGNSFSPTLSADGRHVAFESMADNLIEGDANQDLDVYLRDMDTGTVVRVSVGFEGLESDGQSRRPSMSSDGRRVAFSSTATNLVAGDTNGQADIFVRDLVAGSTVRVSVDSSGLEGDSDSQAPALAPSGSCVAFRSNSTALVTEDTNGHSDVFMRGPLR